MLTKVRLVKAMVFPVVKYGCESWTIKKAERWRTVVLEKTLERSFAGSQREELRPWQRSWGRRFCIRNGGIEPQEFPWKFSSIYPQNQSLSTFCFVLSPTSDFTGGCPPLPLSEKRVNLQLIKFLGVIVFQPTDSFESPLACLWIGFSGHMWLLRASQLWEAWDVLNCQIQIPLSS